MNLKTGCSTWAQAPGVLWAQGASFQGGNSVKYGNFCVYFVCVYVGVYHVFFTLSSVSGYLGCFHILTAVNNATANIGVHVSF